MTTVTSINEREAVEIVAALDISHPDYRSAIDVAFGRRGTRDAVVVLLAQNDSWERALDVFHGLRGGDVSANLDSVYAAAHSIVGSPAIAGAIARLHPDNQMLNLLGQMIERDVPVRLWSDRMATIDLGVCLRFNG